MTKTATSESIRPETAEGTYEVGTIFDAGWLLCGLLFAIAAWQPVERSVLLRRQGRWELVFPSLFGAMALTLLIWDHFERLNLVAIVLSSASMGNSPRA